MVYETRRYLQLRPGGYPRWAPRWVVSVVSAMAMLQQVTNPSVPGCVTIKSTPPNSGPRFELAGSEAWTTASFGPIRALQHALGPGDGSLHRKMEPCIEVNKWHFPPSIARLSKELKRL